MFRTSGIGNIFRYFVMNADSVGVVGVGHACTAGGRQVLTNRTVFQALDLEHVLVCILQQIMINIAAARIFRQQ